MKNAWLTIVLLLSSLVIFAQKDDIEIEITFYVNNAPIEGVKYYFIKDDGKAYLLPWEADKIIIKDTLTSEGIPLLAVAEKHKVVFPVYYYGESDYINIYYDARIFGNKTKKKLGISRWRFLFRKEYYIDIEGFDDIITEFKPEKQYDLIDKN